MLIDICVIFRFLLFEDVLCVFGCNVQKLFLDKYLGVELLDGKECEYSTLRDNTKLFSKVFESIHTPISDR